MALHKCSNSKCVEKASGRNLFCSKCWFHIPDGHRLEIREDTDKGEHTLSAHPSREWMSRSLRYINEPQRPAPKPISLDYI
jgi:hypothetical protein